MAKRVAVILSGCGNKDGAEITEAVSVLVALDEAGAEYQIFAPDLNFAPLNFITGKPADEKRNVLLESARIARGQIQNLKELKSADFEALVLPGGSGVGIHLCTWNQDLSRCTVNPDVSRIINEFYLDLKPIGAVCMAPVLLAKVLGDKGVTITMGKDPAVAREIEKTGALFADCAVDDFVTDRSHRIVTSPAYMYGDAKPFAVFTGIRKAVRELVEMA